MDMLLLGYYFNYLVFLYILLGMDLGVLFRDCLDLMKIKRLLLMLVVGLFLF